MYCQDSFFALEKGFEMSSKQLVLPYLVVTRADTGRLLRELMALEAAIKRATTNNARDGKLLPTSRLLDDLAQQNKLNWLLPEDRAAAIEFLKRVRAEAPVLHFSFSVDPSPRFMEKLVAYIRQEIHAQALLRIGLEPTLGVGCILITTNKYFDFSLRHNVEAQRELLISKVRGAS